MERKIIVYSHKASIVSSFILSMCSLIPGLLAFGGEHLISRKINAYLVKNTKLLISNKEK
jgi:hypothetical protein